MVHLSTNEYRLCDLFSLTNTGKTGITVTKGMPYERMGSRIICRIENKGFYT